MTADRPLWTRELLASPHDPSGKAGRVRGMFNAIAPAYERINTVFSLGRDAVWRRKAVELAKVDPQDRILDIACGTGDFARAFAIANPRLVVGCDFAHQMLTRAAGSSPRDASTRRETPVVAAASRGAEPATGGFSQDATARPRGRESDARERQSKTTLSWCEADALRLPFPAGSFSITSCAFGVRNFEDLPTGLAEMHRVLKRGGRAIILEFTRPSNRIARWLYELYAGYVMPASATLLSQDRSGAYRYLPRSVVSFLDASQMCDELRRAGFSGATATPLSVGVVTIYRAVRD